MATRRIGPVERAARRDLRSLTADVRGSALAQAVLGLARSLDGLVTLDAKEEAALVRELRVSMQALREISPLRAGDELDELRARRAARAADR